MSRQYRKKPVVIEAVQFDGTFQSMKEILQWSGNGIEEIQMAYDDYQLKIKTLEGVMIASKGDYIVKGVQGEFYPCKPDIFKETYEAVVVNQTMPPWLED